MDNNNQQNNNTNQLMNTNPVATNNTPQNVSQSVPNTTVPQQAPQPVVNQNVQNQQPVMNQQTPAKQPVQQNVQPTPEQKQNQSGPKYSFNSEEKVIYKFKEEKDANPIVALLIIALFVVVIFFLPTISKKLGNIKDFNFSFNTNKTTNTNNQQNEDKKNMKYKLNDSLNAAQIGGLSISQLGVGEEYGETFITFTIINKSSESYVFNKKYYINLYNGDKLLYRALIYSDSMNAIGSYASAELKLPIRSNIKSQINQFDVSEIETGKYNSLSVTKEEGEFKVLTCTYQNNEINYYFLDDHLAKIYETIEEESKANNNYLSKRNSAIEMVNKYQSLGLNSHIEERESSFKVINDLDLREIQNITLSSINKHRYFEYGESSKIIYFEMLAMAYSCG